MTGRRALLAVTGAGVLVLQVAIAMAYLSRGTWWHYLLHQLIGWGAGLALAALVAATTRYRAPALVALLGGQLWSITPDLLFLYAGMPHMASMDAYLGHISIHTGPAPTLVALGCVVLGAGAYVAGDARRRRAALGLAAASLGVVLVACLLAEPVPRSLADFPRDAPPV